MHGTKGAKRLTGNTAWLVLEDALASAMREKRLKNMLKGILSPSERDQLAQRVFVARLLVAGWSYRKIRAWTGASPNTIASVDRWLKRENPRYRPLLPLRHRGGTTPKRRGFSDTDRPFPGSIKNFYRSLTGAALR